MLRYTVLKAVHNLMRNVVILLTKVLFEYPEHILIAKSRHVFHCNQLWRHFFYQTRKLIE